MSISLNISSAIIIILKQDSKKTINLNDLSDDLLKFNSIQQIIIANHSGKIVSSHSKTTPLLNKNEEKNYVLRAQLRWSTRYKSPKIMGLPKWTITQYNDFFSMVILLDDFLLILLMKSVTIPIDSINKTLQVALKYKNPYSEEKPNFTNLKSELFENVRTLDSIFAMLDNFAITTITDKHGIITYANNAFCNISKYSKEELIGNSHSMIRSEHHPPEFFKQMWYVIMSGNVWQGIIKNKAKDDTFYWVQSTIAPIFDEQKNISKFIAIRFDITDMIQSKKRMSDFISYATHEIKTPLQPLINYASLADSKIISDHDALEKIKTSSKKLLTSVNELLDFSISQNKQQIRMKKSDLTKVILNVVKEQRIQYDVPITTNLSQVSVLCDEQKLSRVFVNLISNAKRFTKEGKIEITSKLSHEKIIITVSDTGCGIDSAILPNLFDEFVTTDGTGIGLFLVKDIITNHEGTISVRNNSNGIGATFTIILPQYRSL